MVGILPLVHTGIVDVSITNLLWTVVIVVCFSVLYRKNPFYLALESLMIGTTAGYAIVAAVTTLNNNVFRPMATDSSRIIPVILGLFYFTVFIRKISVLYRFNYSARLGVMLGNSVASVVTANIMSAIAQFNKTASDPFTIVALIVGILTIFYFTFSAFVDKRFRVVREASKYVVFMYYAGYGATLFSTRLDNFAGWVFRMSGFPAIIVPVIGLAVILADQQLRKGRTVVSTPTKTA